MNTSRRMKITIIASEHFVMHAKSAQIKWKIDNSNVTGTWRGPGGKRPILYCIVFLLYLCHLFSNFTIWQSLINK